MRKLGWYSLLLMAPNDPPASPGPATPPAPPAPPAPPTPPAPEPKTHTLTDAQFQEVQARGADRFARQLGYKDAEDMKAAAERDKAAQADAEKKRQEQLTREQKLAEEKAAADAKAAQAETEAKSARRDANVTRVCARLGVRNVDYAAFMVQTRNKDAADDPAQLETWLAEQMKGGEAAALGVVPPTPVPTPVTTVPGTNPPAPPAPGGGDPAGGAKDAMQQSAQEWAATKERLGLL